MTSSIPAKRKKKMIFGAILGAIVLALTITWLELFSVLATDVDDLRVLMPDDLDFLIEIRDVPGFVDGLEETGFYSSLDTNDAFQSWWRSPEIRTDPAVVAIQQAWEQLKNPTVELPMGLELVPDITGSTLVVGGWLPEEEGGEPRLVIAFRPESSLGLAAVNVLCSETMCDLFVADQLQGVTVTHDDIGAHLEVVDGADVRTFAVARIGNAVVATTDPADLERIVGDLGDGVPTLADARYRFDDDEESFRPSVRAIFDIRKLAPAQGQSDWGFLAEALGLDDPTMLDALLPTRDGNDLRLVAELGRDLEIEAEIEAGQSFDRRLFNEMTPIDSGALDRQIDEVVSRFPADAVFAWTYQQVSLAEVVRFALSQDFLGPDQKNLWFTEVSNNIPRFHIDVPPGVTPDISQKLIEETDRVLGEGFGIVLFDKPRLADTLDGGFGWAVIAPLDDPDALGSLISEAQEAAGDRELFRAHRRFGVEWWQMVNASAIVNDIAITDPAFGVVDGRLMITNWRPIFESLQEPTTGALADDLDLRNEIRAAPPNSRLAGALLFDPLMAWIDVARVEWAAKSAEISTVEEINKRREIEAEGMARGLGGINLDNWVQPRFIRWRREEQRRRENSGADRALEAKINRWRGLFRWGMTTLGLERGRLRIRLIASPY